MLKALGILLIASPFIGIAVIGVLSLGVVETLSGFGASVGVMLVTFAGLYLIDQY